MKPAEISTSRDRNVPEGSSDPEHHASAYFLAP